MTGYVVTPQIRAEAETIGVNLADALFGRWLAEDPTWRAARLRAHDDLREATAVLADHAPLAVHLHGIAFMRYCERYSAHVEYWDHQQEVAHEAAHRGRDRRRLPPARRVAR